MKLLGLCVSLFVVLGLIDFCNGQAKTPIVKWGQKPDKLFLTVKLAHMKNPVIKMTKRKVFVSGESGGEKYELNLPLLRNINVTTSKYELRETEIYFDIDKAKKEPCWIRATAWKESPVWLKRDMDRWDTDGCYEAKTRWREAYFSGRTKREIELALASGEEIKKKESGGGKMEEREAAQAEWKDLLDFYRENAKKYTKQEKDKLLKKAGVY
eukprot:GDKI01011146.1.p1 GENE.GDKI01011146.1~~GDKI01011146.1.p1  ORF type:complete len:212 (-),score=66.67 GDKI01011146.1:128-763(-)